jgi:hypothetical protein
MGDDNAVMLPWRHGLSFGRAADGSVLLEQRSEAGAGPVVFQYAIPPTEFFGVVNQLFTPAQIAGAATITPGASEPAVPGVAPEAETDAEPVPVAESPATPADAGEKKE